MKHTQTARWCCSTRCRWGEVAYMSVNKWCEGGGGVSYLLMINQPLGIEFFNISIYWRWMHHHSSIRPEAQTNYQLCSIIIFEFVNKQKRIGNWGKRYDLIPTRVMYVHVTCVVQGENIVGEEGGGLIPFVQLRRSGTSSWRSGQNSLPRDVGQRITVNQLEARTSNYLGLDCELLELHAFQSFLCTARTLCIKLRSLSICQFWPAENNCFWPV